MDLVKNRTRLGIVALALGWLADVLFFRQSLGINFPLFTLLTIAAGAWILYAEGARPAWGRSLILAGAALVFAFIPFVRQEPLTIFLSLVFCMVLLVGLALSARGGQWPRFSLSDWVLGFFQLLLGTVTGGGRLFLVSREKTLAEGEPAPSSTRKLLWGLLRGLVLAFPVVLVLGLLLSAADPIFSKRLTDALSFLDPKRWPEYILRLFLILGIAYELAGVFLFGIEKSGKRKLIGEDGPWLKPFLGWVEASVILTGVVVLFSFFVIIQFQYFFGGQANINLEGYTYSEYARRGFGELVWVAVLSLMLYLGLSTITQRKSRFASVSFSALGVLLVFLVGVMLISAFQRLLLYESAYGFTRLRTYTHIFMIWLGVLLALTAALEFTQLLRGFGLALLFAGLGFALTLAVVNVDAHIASQNAARALQGAQLDRYYLSDLSSDAAPTLVQLFESSPAGDARDQMGAELACRIVKAAHPFTDPDEVLRWAEWPSFHLSPALAKTALARVQPSLEADYPVQANGEYDWQVRIRGEWQPCTTYRSMD